MKTIKPESIALFCLSSGDINLAKYLAEMLPMTCFVGEDWQQGFQPFEGGACAIVIRRVYRLFSAAIDSS